MLLDCMALGVLEGQHEYTKMKTESNFGRLEDLTFASAAQKMIILRQIC